LFVGGGGEVRRKGGGGQREQNGGAAVSQLHDQSWRTKPCFTYERTC
jgi:hypothetical protein